MSDSERDSEHDEVNDAEVMLYAKLYFEPNPEYEVPKPSYNGPVLHADHDALQNNTEYGKQEDDVDCGISCIDKNLPVCLKDRNAEETTQEYSSSKIEKCSNNSQSLPEKVSRERYSSICSVDSISGNIPLDDMYCINIESDEEVKDFSKKLAISKVLEEEIASSKTKFQRSTLTKKRKRNIYTYDSDIDESRCDRISNRLLCSTKKDNEEDVLDSSGKNESSEDVYIVPPSIKDVELVNLSSTSDNESMIATKEKEKEFMKKKSEAAILLETFRNLKKKYKGTMETDSDLDLESETDTDLGLDDDETDSDTDTGILCLDHLEVKKKITTNVKCQEDYRESKNKVLKSKRFNYIDILSRMKHTPSCKKWTSVMASFYDSDVAEDFHVQDVHSQQNDSSDYWCIDRTDYGGFKSRYFTQGRQERCKRCREYGHSVSSCPRTPHCHLCASEEHINRQNCPDNCCFKCGGSPHSFCNKTGNYVICTLCGVQGHVQNLCPDLWRRFHLTTSGLQATIPDETERRPRSEQYCFLCAKRGHYGHQCPQRSRSHYYPVPQTIVSYDPPVTIKDGRLVVQSKEGGSSSMKIFNNYEDIDQYQDCFYESRRKRDQYKNSFRGSKKQRDLYKDRKQSSSQRKRPFCRKKKKRTNTFEGRRDNNFHEAKRPTFNGKVQGTFIRKKKNHKKMY